MRVQIDPCKAQMPCVPPDIGERDDACPALQRIKPVAGPRIIADVALATPPDHKSIAAVKEDRQPNPERFQEDDHRQAAEEFHLVRVSLRSINGSGIGHEDVLDQERAYRNNASQGMQSPKQERVPLTGAQRRNSAWNSRR